MGAFGEDNETEDVMIGTNFVNSDQLKQLAFHEIAHASHFQNLNNTYWADLAIAETLAGGHGDQNSNDAGRIAVVESWAEYIGMSYAHKVYGENNSIGGGFFTWQDWLEDTRNESLNHIPVGLHFDLVDGRGNETAVPDQDNQNAGNLTDQVDGFTNQQMFQSLNSSVTTPDQYRNWLNNNFTTATGNTVIDVNNLFNSY